MDCRYFLKERTKFIRNHYKTSIEPFHKIKDDIENEEPPYDNPPYSEDPEPAYLEEWLDADSSIELSGLMAISLLHDALKLYILAVAKYQIGFRLTEQEKKRISKNGFWPVYKSTLGEILQTDWNDCPIDMNIIEQISLARNRAQHGTNLTMLTAYHDKQTLRKYPRPFFADKHEFRDWSEMEGALFFASPRVLVSRRKFYEASETVDGLADWIESRMDKASEWREQQR